MNGFSNNRPSIFSFIQRNLLTIIILVLLIVFAPGVFKFIAVVLLIGMLILISIPLLLAWRVRRMARRMEEQMRQGQGGFYGGFYTHAGDQEHRTGRSRSEGDVKVHVGGALDKKVSDQVGDYVDFEEIKGDKK